MNQRSIAIIGGGFTGMVAALRLAQKGANVTLIEASSELGGLAGSFKIQGEPLEKAYHHLFRTDQDILNLIAELDLGNKLEWFESSVAIYRNQKVWPFMSPADLLKFSPCSLSGRVRLGFVALFLKYFKNWKVFTTVPALEWMRKYCGKSATQAIWEPLLKGKFSNFADQISMGWLWARLHVRTNSRESNGGGEKLGYINGGFMQIISELENRLLALNVKIERATRIAKIKPFENRVVITRNDIDEAFDVVLFTGSNPALNRVLPDTPDFKQYRSDLEKISYLGAVCLVFESAQKIGDYYWVNVNEADSPFLVMIRHTRLIPTDRYNGKEIYYLGAYVPHDDPRFTMSEEKLKLSWFEKLQEMFPDFSSQLVDNFHCFRFRDAQHIVDCSYEENMIPNKSPFNGLYLANFAQIFPYDRGTNFAVQEGEKIAMRIAEDLSLT